MHLGMKNAPANFQGYINTAIPAPLNGFASAYMNDTLIYSDSDEEHVEHAKWIM